MKAFQIKVGGVYLAVVEDREVHVTVKSKDQAGYHVSYEDKATGIRSTVIFKTAARFKRAIIEVIFEKTLITPSQELAEANASAVRATKEVAPEVGSPFRTKQMVDGKEPLPTSLQEKLASRKATPPTSTAPHLIVVARAGTGKTTTLIEGLKIVKGIGSTLTPSPQQKAVWDSMALSKDARTICFVAFNKSIAEELKSRVPMGCDASTMHGMGYKAVRNSFGNVRVEEDKVELLIERITGKDIRDLRKSKPQLITATKALVDLCKMNLVICPDNSLTTGRTHEEELSRLASHYTIDTNGSQDEIFALVPKVLEACKDVKGTNSIDFADMIWLPVVLNLPIFRYDLLLVDEAQDLNRCQQELAKRAGRRLILCGDDKQAIYGFAGADSESMERMFVELNGDMENLAQPDNKSNGCIRLPLTVTRRCGKAIVKEANKIVKDFEAFETNGEGVVSNSKFPSKSDVMKEGMCPKCKSTLFRYCTDGDVLCSGKVAVDEKEEGGEMRTCDTVRKSILYFNRVEEGDMLLCRVNAPLVSECFRFLKMGKKAHIQGRDIGQGLISTINKMKATTIPDLIGKLDAWRHGEVAKEQAKKFPNDAKIIAIEDRVDCLTCFTEGEASIQGVIAKIERIFTDDKTSKGIRLSSIHKAKGLEAKRVFFLMPEKAGCPHPMAKTAWQIEQEWNLKYVGVTRAIEELVFVS